MWDETFDPSMLDEHDVLIIHCPTEELSTSLFEIFEEHGIKWASGDALDLEYTRWKEYGGGTCYRVRCGRIKFGSRDFYSSEKEYHDDPKCTFRGADSFAQTPVASDSEILGLLM